MKKTLCLAILMICFIIISGCFLQNSKKEISKQTQKSNEEFYYYSGGRKVKLAINDDVLVVKHKDAEHSQSNLEFLQKFKELSYEIDTFPKSRNGYFYLRKKDKGISLTMKDIRDLYKIDSGIEWISPGYKSEQGSGFFIGDELIVKFYPHVTIEDINKMNEKYGVETVSKDEWLDQYILRNVHPEISDTLAIANYYYDTPELVNYAVPNMLEGSYDFPSAYGERPERLE